MTDRERDIVQKFLAIDMWLKRARDMLIFENKERARKAFEGVRKCLRECEELNESSS